MSKRRDAVYHQQAIYEVCKLGTDFRPAFEYVNTLKVTGQLNGLKGLIYFTDGKGIYPVAAPTYDVAFVFIKERFSEEDFPAWAMRVVLDEETFNERRQ